ncbi:hypothetical protein FSARC_7677 [Fusarium sarcochroum]|uniref:Uncharacterized protein n=1 Tax=Fusarium sarcochroum TaxID=1208366 RepID=A0A8H4TUG7_9HYPO|nr:hypothetical protein FSARC_7677 [Fusarium sarcochroum]
MELTFFLRAVAFTLWATLTTNVHAYESISIPSNITAGEETEFQLNMGYDLDDEDNKDIYGYRVYLAETPPGWGTGPVCWLAYQVPLSQKTVNVSIPADVAPDKTKIRISVSPLRKGSKRGSGYSYSNRAFLYGGNGTWSQRQKDGWQMGDADEVTCEAYGCVRDCYAKYYTGNKNRIDDGSGDGKARACVKQCLLATNPKDAGSAKVLSMPSRFMTGVVFGLVLVILHIV